MYHPSHECHVVPGLLTIRSHFHWTVPKLLIAAAGAVAGLLILKRFGGVNDYAVQHEAEPYRHQSERHDQVSRPRRRHLRSPPRFIPTHRRRKRLSKRQKDAVLRRYNHQCSVCGKTLQPFDTEMDHIVPLSSDPYGLRDDLNQPDNFRPCCRRCHGYITWRQRKSGMFKRPRRKKT